MNTVLLVVILILLVLLINKINSKYYTLNENNKRLNNNIKTLNDKLNKLINDSVSVKKETESSTVSPVVEKEEISKPEVSKPVIETPVVKPIEPIKKPAEPIQADVVKTYTVQKETPVQQPTSKPKFAKPPTKSLWEQFKEKNPDLEKFIGENLINKLGVLILVLGISYFVKYAIDKDWINEPARVGIGVLCGSLVMLIANKLRKKYAAFSSVLVAGAIAIFYFTIAIAFHEYQLFNQQVAFVIMVVITLFSCLISLSYNRIELAVLSLIGGFAVPFMVSTGSGNYITLFTYIIILNIGITILAFYKKWRLVNTLAFIFTVLLFGAWFIKDLFSETPHYKGALLFAFIFHFIFIVSNVINNVRTKAVFTKIQLVILGISTFLFFGVGMAVLSNYHPEFRGVFTAGLAVFNLILGWFLYKKFKLDKVAIYMLIGLTLTFITLAIPIQFKGNYITLFWAAEAVLLMWLAKKSNITSYRFASIVVHGLSIVSLVIDWVQKYNDEAVLNIVLNPVFGTGIFVVASLFLVYFLLKNETVKLTLWKLVVDTKKYQKYSLIAAVLLLYLVGFLETFFQAGTRVEAWPSVISFPALYHMVFTTVVTFVFFRKKCSFYTKLANIIACVNVVLFATVFIALPFEEHDEIISGYSTSQIAFYLHYVMLALTLFFGFIIYQSNKNKAVFGIFSNKIFTWIAAFLLILIASQEVLLHGLKLLTDSTESLTDVYASSYIIKQKIIKTSFPVLWGVLAFIFLIFGIKKQNKTIRIIALVLLGITIVKLFAYDINNISETGKIIAFILLGVLILIISFVYQKIKVLVIDDVKEDETNEEL